MHRERHFTDRVAWLRAGVLGANDGIVSIASLVIGVVAAGTPAGVVWIAGIAGLAAGALSMAVGEYVSVSSQADLEKADIATEKRELRETPSAELDELAAIYESRGVEPDLSRVVAQQLMDHDALGAHLRDELGITEISRARPWLAGATSATGFCAAGIAPVVLGALGPASLRVLLVGIAAIVLLVVLGASAAKLGNAPLGKGILRVTTGGIIAMGIALLVGRLLGGIAV